MLISATGMGLVPLFSRWATRTDMFDGALGLNAGDSIGALMAVGRMRLTALSFSDVPFISSNVASSSGSPWRGLPDVSAGRCTVRV